MAIKNIGILAHVDAGKTTITENLLFAAGAIRNPGSVDKGTSVSDSMDVEKERGISVKASCISFQWKKNTINLIDTPGHADFSSEVERSLAVTDAVILTISAVEGVQAHTLSLWNVIEKYKKPCLIFINKTDREGSDLVRVIHQVKRELFHHIVPLYAVENENDPACSVVDLFDKNVSMPDANFIRDIAIESLAEYDESVLSYFVEGQHVVKTMITSGLCALTSSFKVIPVLCGVAKTGQGIAELLNAIDHYLPSASIIAASTGGLVFKVERDKNLGKIGYFRLFGGRIKAKDQLFHFRLKKEVKIAQLKKRSINKLEDKQELTSGDVGVISGIEDIVAGDILGDSSIVPNILPIQESVLAISVKPVKPGEISTLAGALFELNDEDPALNFQWDKEENELQVNLMGYMQIEILQRILQQRFGLDAIFEEPLVIYKETPAASGEATVNYTMPKPCWAVMTFGIEPGPPGSGIVYSSRVSVNDIQRKYQNEVEKTIPKGLLQGIKGWAVTDIKISLLSGEDHEIHSRPGDFILAAPMGIMAALKKAGTKLLEPVYLFEIFSPEEYLGIIVSDLTKMRAIHESPVFEGDNFSLKGQVPVAEAMKYQIRLSSLSGGKAKLRLRFGGYIECPDGYGKERPYKGVNPLNQSQWILHHRGAYKANERRF